MHVALLIDETILPDRLEFPAGCSLLFQGSHS